MSFIQKYARSLGVLEYLGTWDADLNDPPLASGVGQRGGYYIVSVSGTTNLDGENDWNPPDWVIFNGTVWEKIDNSDLVTSVADKTGDVILDSGDITDFVGAAQSAVFPALVQPGLRYVSPSGNPLSASGGYAAPFQTIAAALVGASAGDAIVLFPGTYNESQVALPNDIVLRGMAPNSCTITNGVSITPGASEYVSVNIENVSLGELKLDAALASNGVVAAKHISAVLTRVDTNFNVLFQVTESTIDGGTIAGAGLTLNECLMVSSIEIDGGLTILENSKVISRVEAHGSATVRMMGCSLFGATEFINGTIVSSQTPVWEPDAASDSLGGYTGDITKNVLASITTGQISDFSSAVGAIVDVHANRTDNPHSVTKSQVGLGNVDNTSDLDKPISTSTQTALDAKEDAANKSDDTALSADSSTLFPTQHAVKTYADTKVEANSAITAGTATKVTYDSKGLVTAGSSAALTDLSDTAISSPIVDQILKWNGTAWANSSNALVNAGPGTTYFLTTTASGVDSYDFISKSPDNVAEVDENVTLTTGSPSQIVASYISDATLNRTTIDAGIWEFNFYTYVSSQYFDTTVGVYKRTSGGTETLLFSADNARTNWTTVQLLTITTVQQAFTCNATDSLVIKITFSSDKNNIVAYLVHSGTTHYSHFHTPLVLNHNDIVGLQGGTSNQYYHLTSAEYTGVGTGAFVRNSELSNYVPTTRQVNGHPLSSDVSITKSDVGLGNVDNTSDVNKPVSTAQQAAINQAAYYFAIVL